MPRALPFFPHIRLPRHTAPGILPPRRRRAKRSRPNPRIRPIFPRIRPIFPRIIPQNRPIPRSNRIFRAIRRKAPSSPEQPAEPTEPEKPQPQQNLQLYIICTGSGVNLRSGAGSGYKAVASAEKDTSYAVAEKTGNWYCVYYRGKKVYLSATYAREFTLEKSDNAAVERVLAEAYKLLGTPYVFGAVRLHDGAGNFQRGFTVNAFDCSSLTQYVFYLGANKLLGTTTRLQVKEGKAVKKSELSRGDCIYFTNASRYYNTGTERVGHVAIYLGNDYILHTSSDYARIEKLTAARKKYYIEARRFV